MAFNINKACQAIVHMASGKYNHAGNRIESKLANKGYGNCVGHVRLAMKMSGYPNFTSCVCGWKFYKSLQQLGGWVCITNQVQVVGKQVHGCKYGDICCSSGSGGKTYANGDPIGHGALYTPRGWVSDFIQGSAIPYSEASIMKNRTSVWRYTGAIDNSPVVFDSGEFGDDLTEQSMYGINEEQRAEIERIKAAMAQQNAYPVHKNYTLFNAQYGNLFENSNYDAFSKAMFANADTSTEIKQYRDKDFNIQGRVYSTNDAFIVLDELSLPTDYKNDKFVSSDIDNKDRKVLQANNDKMVAEMYTENIASKDEEKSEENKDNKKDNKDSKKDNVENKK